MKMADLSQMSTIDVTNLEIILPGSDADTTPDDFQSTNADPRYSVKISAGIGDSCW
jgi:hypothetical protein